MKASWVYEPDKLIVLKKGPGKLNPRAPEIESS